MDPGRVVRAGRKEVDQKHMDASLQCRNGLVDQIIDVAATVLVRRRNDLDQRDQAVAADVTDRQRAASAQAAGSTVCLRRTRGGASATAMPPVSGGNHAGRRRLWARMQREYVRDRAAGMLLGQGVVSLRQQAFD